MKPMKFIVATLLVAGCSRRNSLARPADIPIAELSAPVPARLWVGSSRRDITVPWSQTLHLASRDRSIVAEGTSGEVPQAPFANALAEDSAGERIAYRIGPRAPWRIVYVTPTALWLSCAPPVTDATVDWSRVPDVVSASATLAACPGVSFAPLADEVRRRGGVASLAALLSATLTNAGDTDAWEAAFRSLPAESQRPIRARAERALTSQEPAFSAPFDRLARIVDVDATGLDAQRLQVLARFCQPGPGLPGCGALYRRLARIAPDDAADFACEQVNGRNLNPLEAAALARATRPCEEFRTLHRRNQCVGFRSVGLTCGDAPTEHPCSRAEYLAMVDAELSPGGVQGDVPGGYHRDVERLLAAAAMQQGVDCAPFADAGR